MENKLRDRLAAEKVSRMKSPVIVMNDKDFEDLKTKLEDEVSGLSVGIESYYSGIPIRTSEFLERGFMTIYDESYLNLK